MSVVKWQKDDEFASFSSMFDDLFGRDYNKGLKTGTTVPAVNLREDDKSYQIEMAAPGLKKEDFKIDLHENIITISSQKQTENEVKDEQQHYTRREFSFTSFSRSFNVPENTNLEGVSASYENGVLSISLPKKEIVKPEPKQINIQ